MGERIPSETNKKIEQQEMLTKLLAVFVEEEKEIAKISYESLEELRAKGVFSPKQENINKFLEHELDNIEKLKKDMNNPKIDEIIKQDREDATIMGVRGTPTIFVNGVELTSLSPKALFNLVEKEIYK